MYSLLPFSPPLYSFPPSFVFFSNGSIDGICFCHMLEVQFMYVTLQMVRNKQEL